MKKSIIVNICGIIFHVDEDAYEILNNYLETLKKYFIPRKGGNEIIEDIEARIAELLQPKLSGSKQSVTIEDINEVITVLGKPEDITGAEDDASENQKTENNPTNASWLAKRLYRDPENAVIAGISSGMGAYFKIDPVFFRLIFVGLIFAAGVGIILYLVLWIAVPEAITASQRLEMRGEDVTVSNIEKNIQEENSSKRNTGTQKLAGFFRELAQALSKIIMLIGKGLKYFFAISFIFMALAIITGFIASVFFSNFAISNGFVSNIGSIQEFLGYFLNPANRDLLLLLSMAIILIPCAGLIYWGLKIIIRFKANDKWISASMSVLWILTIVVFVVILLTEVNRFKSESVSRETVTLQKPSKNILYIQSHNTTDKIMEFSDENFNNSFFGVETVNTKKRIFAPIEIEFDKTSNDKPELEIIRKAHASDYEEAKEARENIKVDFNQQDSILYIDPFFHLMHAEQWNFQHTRIIIRVPENMDIRFDKNMDLFIEHWRFYEYYNNHAWEHVWRVTHRGLERKK